MSFGTMRSTMVALTEPGTGYQGNYIIIYKYHHAWPRLVQFALVKATKVITLVIITTHCLTMVRTVLPW